MLASRPTAQVYFGEQKVMKIRNFLLNARSAHTPKHQNNFNIFPKTFDTKNALSF